MSMYGSQKGLNMSRTVGSKGDLTGMGTTQYARSEVVHGGGNGYDPYLDGYQTYSFSKSSGGGMASGTARGMGGGMASGMSGGTVTRMMGSMGGGMASGMSGGRMSTGGGRMSTGGGMMSTGGGMMSTGGGMMSTGGGMMSTGGGMMSTMGGGMLGSIGDGMAGGMSSSSSIQQTMSLQAQCQEYLKKAEYALQSGGSMGDAERYMMMAKDTIEQLKMLAMDMRDMGQPPDNVIRTMEMCKDQLKGVHMAMTGSMNRRRSTRGSSGGWEEPGRSFQDAMAWIAQQKRLIETSSWGDDAAAINQQLNSHQNFHSSIQRSAEVDRAKDDLVKKGDKGNLHALDQEWDTLQKMSFGRTEQLQELKQIIQDMSKEIMWVNDREEEELMFDWGDKNIDQYIPRKQESYSKLMSALEDKEKDLNKLKSRVDALLKSNHPASDKIEAYKDTLQTQWSWLLQITKCIDVHLKENAAYSQFFKEANETYSSLQKEHETVRRKFTCDKNTSLENLMELLRGLEREKEKIMENKRQVQHLVNKSKSIVRLKPRNPEEKSSSPVFVKALCDFKQDQKVICKENKAILKDNSQRSKWDVTGPGGLDMLVPSVCLIVPPPNPLGISLANKNEQYYEAIMSIWNQLYINVKSLISWQYCLLDIKKINSLTVSMLSRMRPEEYRQLIKSLETHYEEFKLNSHGSQMFADEDKRSIENQFTGAQTHYEQIVVQLPTYIVSQGNIEAQQAAAQQAAAQQAAAQQAAAQQAAAQQAAAQQAAEARRLEEEARMRQEEAWRLEEEARMREEETRRQQEEARRLEEEKRRAEVKKVRKSELKVESKVVKKQKAPPLSASHVTSSSTSTSSSSSSRSLSELHALRLKLEGAENTLSQHVHICLGDDGMHDCGLKISQLETLQQDVESLRAEYLRLRGGISMELEGMNDSDKAQFLRSEIGAIDLRLGSLESSSSAYVQRLQALRDMLESVARAEDIVKVHEARLTEKETTSLSHSEVGDYMLALKNIKAELDQKKDVLASMEAELAKASHWNSQVGGPFHRCDMMLSKYTEQVNLLSDRWRRIQGQIDTRVQDLQLYQPQLQHYKQTSTSLIDWIDVTKKKQDALQATKIESIQGLTDHINNQKALNSEILGRRETVESVLKDNETCVNAIKDYETDLASYTSGLETLLNIPIKRTMLKSPSMDLNLEATQLQTRYMELLTHSGDYYKFLGELLKNMEELKIRNTRIDLLEEELRLLRENMQDRNAKNKSLEDAVSRYRLELSNSQDMLLSMEEVKQTSALQCNATKDSLDSTQSQLADLNDEVTRLKYLLEEEKRKKRLAEDRYTTQQEEYELVLRRRQNELDTVSRSKTELEKSVSSKDHEIVMLQRQLAEEAARFKELQREMSKTTASTLSIQSQYSEIVNERDALLLKLKLSDKDKDRYLRLEEELSRIKLSQDSELRNKQRLQEENERVKRDLDYWKEQYESKQGQIRQYDTDKERLESEKNTLKSEIERLMRELRELDETYKSRLSTMQKELREVAIVRKTEETELMRVREPPTLDASTLIFDGVRKPVTANQLLDCGVLDKPTFTQLAKGHKTVPDVSNDKKVSLKGTGPIAGVVIGGLKGPGSITQPIFKMTFTEAKKENLLPPDSVDLLLDAQAATGHIIDPRTNQKLTVKEACDQGVVDEDDKERLLAAEAAAVGYRDPGTSKPLSVFQAMKKGLIDKNTTLRLLQAQESVGGILDPVLSVFLPKDTAIDRNLINNEIYSALNRSPELYLDPESEDGVTYISMKRRCKVELQTGLLLLPISEKVDPSKLVFDGVRKPVTAKQLLDCGVLDKPTFIDLEKGKQNVPEVSVDKNVNLKGTGPIAGVVAGSQGKLSFSEAKKQMLLPEDSADLLLEAQAATGHIINPRNNQKLTVEDACARGVVDISDRDRLLAAEAAAVGYKDSSSGKPFSVFEAMKKGVIDRKTGLRLLQAQESVGGILDPNLSVFLPKDTAIKRNLLDENLRHALNQSPECYRDPETERDASYDTLKKRCKTEPHTGLLLLPITEKLDPSKLIFDGVRKQVTAKQLLDCGVLDKATFNQLMKGEKTVPEVSVDNKVFLKGTGSIAGVAAGPSGKMSLSEAKKQMLMPPESADLLLDAQAATGHIIDPTTNQKLTVEEACARRVVDNRDRDRLLTAEAAAVGYRDPSTDKPLSVFEAIKKGLIDRNTGLRLLQAQESAGGILDPNLSVFLPIDTAIKRNLLDENLRHALNQSPECYRDPETERDASYDALKKRCKTEPHTGLLLLPITEKLDPSKLIFDGVRKQVTAKQLLDCGVLDKATFNQLMKGEKTVPEVSVDNKVFLKGTGSIAGVAAGPSGKMSLSEAKKQMLMPPESADLLLDAQAATGHIIDPTTNQKLTVEEACAKRVVDNRDRDRLLAAEAAAVGYWDPSTATPLSVFEAIKKGLIDRKTGLRLLQAQESAGGILDPNLSVFLPKDTAIKRNLLDDDLCRALNQSPTCYIDPNTEHETSYGTLKKRSKTESHTGLILLPIKERKDPSKLMFDGIRKSVSAQQLFECGVIDKPTLDQLVKGEKTVSAVSMEKTVYLKGTGAIGGVLAGREGKMSFSEAKKQLLLPSDSAYLLLEAQAATGYIIDPETIQQLTVEEACARGVVDIRDRDRLLAAEAAAVGFKDPSSAKLLSVFEAMEKGLIDRKTGLRLLQAQESVGGIIDPNLSVFLPKDTAIKRNLLDENLRHALNQSPECYRDPETESGASYGTLQERCKTESQATLQLLPITEKFDPSKLVFDGVRKTVTAQQLLDCGVLNKATFNQLLKGEKTVSEVSVDIKVFLMGTGSIAGVTAGPFGKMSFTEAKKQKMMSSDSADMLLEAQAATGNIIDPKTNQKMTVKEACARGVVDKEDESKLYAAEAAIIGYRDPNTGKLLSAGQAMKKGLIDKDTALRILQAQESVGGILDPALSIFLPKDIAMNRDLIDEDLYQSLNQYPACYLDPDTQQATTYVYLKKKCKVDPKTGLLLLPEPKKPLTVQGLRDQVSVIDLVDANLLSRSVMDQLREGRLTSRDIEDRLCSYLRGSTCIAGVYDEASDNVMPIYQAMKDGLLKPENTLELLEAQAASGFIIDPVNNHYLTVSDAYNKRLFGPEFKDNLLAAEKAVTGYKLPGTDKVLSLFQAIKRGLVEKGHGMRLLEAQFASGGIVDPEHSHRIDVNEAYKRGYFDKEMNKILTDQNVDTQGFFDPNTEENLTYLELKKRCISDKKTGLILLPIKKDLESTLKNTLRKRRVVIVDPETNKEMTVREAYDKGYIDYDTFMELSEQECEWEEITITDPDGSTQFRIIDRKTGRQYDITELLEKRVIDQSDLDDYRSRTITLTQFADIIGKKSKYGSSSSTTSRSSTASGTTSVKSSSMISNTSASPGTSSVKSSSTLRTSAFSVPSSVTSLTSSVLSRPLSPTLAKMTTTRTTTVTEQSSSSSSVAQDSLDSLRGISSVSITLASPLEAVGDQEPVGAIFDTDTLEKITITEALDRDLMDSITAQRLLEAQACTGGIIDPTNGHRHSIQEATRLGIITADMASKLKPAQKAFFGFEDVKTRKKMSAAQAMKEMWLPYEAGQRFLEFQVVTGGLYDPEMGCRRSIEDAVNRGWLDARTGQKLQDVRNHTKNLTCPKTKLKISYKQALDNCLVEESNGLKMLQASSVSSRGISSPYNVSSAPGSTNGSRSGSRRNSRRSSVDLGSPNSSSSTSHYSRSFTTFSSSTN
ncbi:desmoplakin-A-like isoform X2 [Clinocottus analis]|uniref:desmoplakin-A-like isoform X2 n=1 Tax=Clinocottus analis TaxID=304258 RepID=UPI0035C1614E